MSDPRYALTRWLALRAIAARTRAHRRLLRRDIERYRRAREAHDE